MKVKSISAKALSIVLAVLLSLTAVVGVAAASGVQIAVDTVSAKAGEEVTVPIRVTENSGFGGFKAVLTYDAEKLTFESLKNVDVISSGLIDTKNEAGTLTVVYANTNQLTAAGKILEVTFTVAEGVEDGDIALTLEMSELFGYTDNKDVVPVPAQVSNGAVRIGGEVPPISSNPDTDDSKDPNSGSSSSQTDNNSTTSEASQAGTQSAASTTSGDKSPSTGDSTWGILLLAAGALAVGGYLIYRQKKNAHSA